jgi:hypothetical protein
MSFTPKQRGGQSKQRGGWCMAWAEPGQSVRGLGGVSRAWLGRCSPGVEDVVMASEKIEAGRRSR